MGQCGGRNSKGEKKAQLQAYWKQPADTEKFCSIKLPKLKFQGCIANFKIKKCAYTSLSVRMGIKGVETFYLCEKKIREDQTAKWSFEQKFGFQMTEYELRKSFLKIDFFDDSQEAAGSIQVNLYLISTGPYHQDFAVNLKKEEKTRISFDMKISQIVEIQVESLLAEIDLITKHPGEKFNFSIKTIVGQNTPLHISSPSYGVRERLDNKEKSQIESSETSFGSERGIRKKRKEADKEIDQGKNMVWEKEENSRMPSIAIKILVSELHHAYFQILLWKIDQKCTTKEQKQTPELYGECYIALHKLFEQDPTAIIYENKEMQQHTIATKEKLWHHGKYLGKGSFKFSTRNDPYIKQMQVCVRTEDGVKKYSPVFTQDEEASRCQELQELRALSQDIESNVEKLDKLQISGPNIESRKLKVAIQKSLERIISLLESSSKQSIVFYSYSSEKELLKAQEMFINLGHRIVSYLQEEDLLINEFCWQILIALIRRGEFSLAHIGFDDKEKDKIRDKDFDKKLTIKIEVAIMYKQFLHKLLDLSLRALNLKGLELQRTFSQVFCAYAYFRIPNFRTKVLESIQKEEDPEIYEWRGIQFSLQDEINYDELKMEVNTFTMLCDWSNSFHKCIQHEERAQAIDYEMNELLHHQQWRNRMSKRGIAFFYFVKYWVQYIQSIAVKTRDIQWKYFPGYNKLIKCFLVQLKKRKILEYPDALKEACFQLLINQKLLNAIILIIYGKANINEPLTVIKAIQFINQIFNSLATHKRKIPATFNYHQFYKGLKTIFESDFSFGISKAIIMIYNHFHIFNLEFRRHISMYFLGKIFFNLFLHWSNNVRDAFHHFLTMRVYREAIHFHQNDENQGWRREKNNQEIRTRYQKLMLILDNAQKVKNEEDKIKMKHIYEKDLHKKLKKKLFQKKKRKRSSIDQIDEEFIDLQTRKSCPNSPGRQLLRRSSLRNEKYSIKNLTKNRQPSRYHSQVLKPKVELIASKSKQNDVFDEVKRAAKNPRNSFKHQFYDTTIGKGFFDQKQLPKLSQYDQNDFEIGAIHEHMVGYLPIALQEFRKISDRFMEHANDKNWEVPQIKIQMPLDGKEIKPDKIDDW